MPLGKEFSLNIADFFRRKNVKMKKNCVFSFQGRMTEQGVMDIGKIRFGVLSPQDIRDMAVCKVDVSKMNSGSGTIYDKLMGPVADTNEECKLCGLKKECMGHFGYTELPEPVFQPIFIKYILSFLRCFCIKCYRLLVSKEQLELE